MKISYNLLKNFIDFRFSPRELASVLTSIGIESYVVNNDYCWSNVVTAKVFDIKKHPIADKLYLCKLTDGLNNYSVVCSKNIFLWQIVPFAKPGAILPGNIRIKKTKIMGEHSDGMICSESDLRLKNNSNEILIFDENTKLGVAIENILTDDQILEIEITMNRGDCLSYLGIAREISAKICKPLLLPKIKTFNLPKFEYVKIEANNLCQRYIGVFIRNVKIDYSPKWIVDALLKNGIKPINNVVDITNYVMLELGQPLHAFDIEKISSNKIFVRKANNDETIIALNEKKYILNSEDIVISDDNKPIAIAGIIGGLHSSITKETRNIFLESAIFDAGLIRKTSRKLGLTTDSSYRFERGVGWDITELASWRSVNLITKIAGGTIEFRQDLKIIKYERKNVCLRLERISKILGYDIKKNNIIKILKFLGIDIQLKDEIILCSIPSWRNDIKIEVDLIEEIARINGYNNDGDASIAFSNYKNDNIETSVSSSSACDDSLFFPNIVENFRIKLNSLGFNEVLNYSFLEVDELKKFGLKYFYKIINPISKENEILRPSMLPSLYKNLLFNINYSYEKIALFEYGKIFDKYGERKVFAAIMYGKIWDEWWKWSEKMIIPKYDFYFGAGIVKNILLYYDEFEIDENSNHENYYHPGKTAGIFLKKKRVGQFGILNPTITSDDLNEDVFYFEINVDLFKNFFEKKLSYKTYSKFPVIRRDISVVVEKKIKFSEIENIIIKFMKLNSILIKYSLFSVYHDENKFGKNRISYSIRLFYQNDHKTLVDKEVNESMVLLLGKLREKYEIELRK